MVTIFSIFFFEKMEVFNFFSNSCCHIQIYCTFDWPENKLHLQNRVSKIKKRLLQEVFFCDNQSEKSYSTLNLITTYITKIFVSFVNFTFLGKRPILINVFQDISEGSFSIFCVKSNGLPTGY